VSGNGSINAYVAVVVNARSCQFQRLSYGVAGPPRIALYTKPALQSPARALDRRGRNVIA